MATPMQLAPELGVLCHLWAGKLMKGGEGQTLINCNQANHCTCVSARRLGMH